MNKQVRIHATFTSIHLDIRHDFLPLGRKDNSEGGFQWRDRELTDLVYTLGDVAVQAELEGAYRNCSMFEEIPKEMAIGEPGYSATGKFKVKQNLKKPRTRTEDVAAAE